MNKIAIIITTFERDELLLQSVQSVLLNRPPSSEIYIIDQSPTKQKIEYYSIFAHYIHAPYNCGLSYSRNLGVELARRDGCTHILISADSILFDATMVKCGEMVALLDMYDIVGMQLNNRIEWEAKLKLVPGEHFELHFIDKSIPTIEIGEFKAFDVDICRNFFIAKTEVFDKVKWDEDLRLGEHECFFHFCQQNNIKVGWCPNCTGNYIGVKDGKYADFRRKNFNEGLKTMKKKMGISGWCVYKNLDRAKKDMV